MQCQPNKEVPETKNSTQLKHTQLGSITSLQHKINTE